MSMLNNRYIHVEKINDRLYCLKEVESICRYLILGDKKAMLFDSGYGYIDFTMQIRELTDLPLVVVNSHGDPDHALGSYLFPQVYLHYGDFDYLMRLDRNSAKKRDTIDYRLKKLPGLADEMDIEGYIKPNLSKTEFLFLEDGMAFDLGGLTLKVIHIPGHTPGSVALFCEENGWLFTGDSVDYYNIFYQGGLGHHMPFKVYVRSLRKLEKLVSHLSHIYPAHGQTPIPPFAIGETIDAVYDLLENWQDDEERATMIGSAYAHFYGNTFILYGKDILDEARKHGLD